MRRAGSKRAVPGIKRLVEAASLPRAARSTCFRSKLPSRQRRGRPARKKPRRVRSARRADCRCRRKRASAEHEELRMASYLTREDEQNFGPELLDVAIRAARHAVSPELQRLHEENQELQGQLNSATKMTIDRELDAAVPDWRQINADERFHSWLLMPEPYSGVIRDRLLKDAAAAGDAQRLVSIFQGFLAAAGQAPAGHASQ